MEAAGGGNVELGSSGHYDAGAGDRLVVETPGGGGYGEPETTR
jgi:5-oxoprolinase (ATP-hydrolysing)